MDNHSVEPDLLTDKEYNKEVDKPENSTENITENISLTVDNNGDGINVKRKSNVNKFHVNRETSKDHWKTIEELVNALQKENERLTNQLAEERHRSFINQKKLRYIQEHQDIFERLKDDYLKNKAANPVIHRSKDQETEILTIQRTDLNALKSTVNSLKNSLTLPPQRNFEIRESKYRKDIAILFKENMTLNEQIKTKNIKLETIKKQLVAKNTQNIVLRKIVTKLLRKISQTRHVKHSIDSLLNISESEKRIIDRITTKYGNKASEEQIVSAKSSKSSQSEEMSEDNGNLTPYYTPRQIESP
ncbi:hypothetical protein CBL_06890 [Carabus blaptoides fortunei]